MTSLVFFQPIFWENVYVLVHRYSNDGARLTTLEDTLTGMLQPFYDWRRVWGVGEHMQRVQTQFRLRKNAASDQGPHCLLTEISMQIQ